MLYHPRLAPPVDVESASTEQVSILRQEIEELKKSNNEGKEGVKKKIYNVLEKVLKHRIKLIVDKLESVYDCYNSLTQAID